MAEEKLGLLEKRIRERGEHDYGLKVAHVVRQMEALLPYVNRDVMIGEPVASGGVRLLNATNEALQAPALGVHKVAYKAGWLMSQLGDVLMAAGREEAGNRAVTDFIGDVNRLRAEVESLTEAVDRLEDAE